MARRLRIVQFASFCSNLGDNANISGLRWLFRQAFPSVEIAWSDWDIVDYSFTRSYSDEDIEWVNSHDLLIVGGGGFFEILPDSPSWTGTRFNIPEPLFEKISIPIMFHGLGTHRVRADMAQADVSDQIRRFHQFFAGLRVRPDCLISFRTDGSRGVLPALLPNSLIADIPIVADAGLYADPTPPRTDDRSVAFPETAGAEKVILVNFGGDLLDARFPDPDMRYQDLDTVARIEHPSDYEHPKIVDHAGFNRFITGFADLLRTWLDRRADLAVVFVPHIYRDIQMGAALLTELGFPYNRRRVTMAPYLYDFAGHDRIFNLYKSADLVIGMRYHANVCPVGFGTPTIGLVTFPMLSGFYREINSEDRCADVTRPDVFRRIDRLIAESLAAPEPIRARYATIRAEQQARSMDFVGRLKGVLDLS